MIEGVTRGDFAKCQHAFQAYNYNLAPKHLRKSPFQVNQTQFQAAFEGAAILNPENVWCHETLARTPVCNSDTDDMYKKLRRASHVK